MTPKIESTLNYEIKLRDERWEELKAKINHAIKYPISGTPDEMRIAQHELEDVKHWMEELEKE